MSKRSFLWICFILIFAFSACGVLFLAKSDVPASPLSLTLKISHCDNALAEGLRERTGAVTVNGAAAHLESVLITPSPLKESENGVLYRFPSTLYSDVTLSLSLMGEWRGDVLYASSNILSVGASVLFSSFFYQGYAVITAVRPT